jgi:tyrosinase
MNLPKDAEVLGANSEELEIKGPGAHTIVKINSDFWRNQVAGSAKTSPETFRDRVCLLLENVRGTRDATVLNVFINMPEGEMPGDNRKLLVGSVGLYGLRQASNPRSENGGAGLTFILELTKVLMEQSQANALADDEILVNIVPNHPLPDSSDIVVGRVSLFRQTV